MGRNLKKRKAKLEQQRRKQMTRRRFLQIGAIAAVATGLGLLTSGKSHDKWAFLDRKVILPGGKIHWKEIADQAVPLQPEREMSTDELDYQEFLKRFMPAAMEQVKKRGWSNVSSLVTEQLYGKPDAPEFTEPHKEYLEKTIDYLYSRIPRLKRMPLELTILKKGQDFSHVKSGRAFIGYSFHQIRRMYIENERTGHKFLNGESSNHDGSMQNVTFSEDGKITDYIIFFGNGPMALFAAGSEIIPWTTGRTPASYDHFKKFGEERHKLSEESISEGISYILGEEMIKEFDIPDGERRLRLAKSEMEEHIESEKKEGRESRYRLVRASERWLRKNGIEDGLDLYMESPEAYLTAISQ